VAKTVHPGTHIVEAAWGARIEAGKRARALIAERDVDEPLGLLLSLSLPLYYLAGALRSVDPARSAEELLGVALAEAVSRRDAKRLRAPSEGTWETYAALIEHSAFLAAGKAAPGDRVRAGADRLKRKLTSNPRAAHLFGLSWVVSTALREGRADLRDEASREMDEVLTERWERIVAACFTGRGPLDGEAAWRKWHHIRGTFKPLLNAWNRRSKKVSRFVDTVKATVRDPQSVAVEPSRKARANRSLQRKEGTTDAQAQQERSGPANQAAARPRPRPSADRRRDGARLDGGIPQAARGRRDGAAARPDGEGRHLPAQPPRGVDSAKHDRPERHRPAARRKPAGGLRKAKEPP